MVSCVGLTLATGGEGACITSRIFFGGWSYPDATLTADEVVGVATANGEFGCSGAAQAASVATRKKVKAI